MPDAADTATKGGWVHAVRRWRLARPLCAWAAITAVILAIWTPLLRSPRVNNESLDWTYRSDYMGYALHALFDDHQFPFWVTSGRFEQLRVKGIHDFFANPETDVLSLVTLLARPLGYLTAVKIMLVVCLGAGVYGNSRLLRAFSGRASPLATLLLSLLVLCNGTFVANVIIGHVQFFTYALFPLALSLLIEAWDSDRTVVARGFRAAGSGGLCALSYYAGNTHPLIHFLCLFVIGFTALSVLLSPRSSPRLIAGSIAVGVSFFALGAFKLVPGFLDFHAYRTGYLVRYDGWHDLAVCVLTPWREMVGGYPHERNAYVGWLGLFALSLAFTGWNRKTAPLVAIAASLPFLMFAKEGDRLLELPLMRTQGALTRFMLDVFLGLSVAASVRVNDLVPRLRGLQRRAARFAGLGLMAGLCAGVAIGLGRNVREEVALACVNAMPNPSGPFDEPLRLVPEHPRLGKLTAERTNANATVFAFSQVDPSKPEVARAPDLHIEEGRPHLRVTGDAHATTRQGNLAVELSGRRGSFRLEFWDPATWWSLALTVASALGLCGAAFVARWRERHVTARGEDVTGEETPPAEHGAEP